MEISEKLSDYTHSFKYNNNKIELSVVDISELIPHEEVDDKKIDIIFKRIKENQCIKHTISCIRYADKFIVLDGHHRLMSLKLLGYKKAPIQIVNKESVILDYWYHVINDPQWNSTFINHEAMGNQLVAEYGLKKFDDLMKVNCLESNDIFNAIQEIYQSYRMLKFSRQLEKPCDKPWVKYSGLTLDVMIENALKSNRLPPGLSRFRIPYKVLNLEIPLCFLEDKKGIDWKKFYQKKREFQVFDLPVITID